MDHSRRTGWQQRRWVRVTSVGLIVAVVAVGIRLLLPKPRLLLSRAHPIVHVQFTEDTYGDQWDWVSDEKLILLSTDTVADKTTGWRGRAELLNVATGERTPLKGLTALLNRDGVSPGGTPYAFEFSPGHSWLVWNNYTDDQTVNYGAAHLDGTHYRVWKFEGEYDFFFVDAGHLAHHNMDTPDKLNIRDLANPNRDRQIAVTAPTAKAVLARHEAQEPTYVDVMQSREVQEGQFVINTYRTGDTVQAMRYDYHDTDSPPVPLQRHFVKLPEGASVVDAETGTKQSAVFYHLRISETSPLLDWMRQHLPLLTGKPTVREALWVSRTDGGDFHEVGQMPARRMEEANKNELQAIEWLPGGEQISFFYRDTLYVVPADLKN